MFFPRLERRFSCALLAALAACFSLGAAAQPAAPTGPWLSNKGGTIVEIAPCEDAYCGKITWLKKPRRKSGELRLDRENPDPELRDRPWCGMTVIWGLKPGEDGVWSGEGYDPKSGYAFDVDLRPIGKTMTMRAYLGLPLFGLQEGWARPDPEHPNGCTTEP